MNTTPSPSSPQDRRIQVDVVIHASPAAVWDALTGAPGVAALYFGSRLETTFAPGAPYRYAGDDGKGNDVSHVEGEVIACKPRELLELTHRAGPVWRKAGAPVYTSRLAYRLEPVAASSTKLIIVQDRFDDGDPGYAHNVAGWPEFLQKVKALVERT